LGPHTFHQYRPRILRAVYGLFGSLFQLQLAGTQYGESFDKRLFSRMVDQGLIPTLASADDYVIGLTQQSPDLLD